MTPAPVGPGPPSPVTSNGLGRVESTRGFPGENAEGMGDCRGGSQGGWSGGPGADWGKGSAVKGDRAAPAFMVMSGPDSGDAVETKKKREWTRRKGGQRLGHWSSI